MSVGGLHVVFGTGQVGLALADRLAGLNLTVRTVSRRRPAALADNVEWRAADAPDLDAGSDAARGASAIHQCLHAPPDLEAAGGAARGASVIYQSLTPPYPQCPKFSPPLQRGVLTAAERAGA